MIMMGGRISPALFHGVKMRILAIDQARNGAWSVFDYESHELLSYGTFSFPSEEYTYAKTMVLICDIVESVVREFDIDAIFAEDIQMRKNVDSFKKLAQLQGSLVSLFERNEYLYDFVAPSKWQSYCNARGRTSKEIKAKAKHVDITSGKKQSKMLSIQFVRDNFGIDTEDDNLADAICIGFFVVNNVPIVSEEAELKEN